MGDGPRGPSLQFHIPKQKERDYTRLFQSLRTDPLTKRYHYDRECRQ